MSAQWQTFHLISLNDHILLVICDAVKDDHAPIKDGQPRRDMQSLKALSQCSHRLHRLIAPKVLRSIRLTRLRNRAVAQQVLTDVNQSKGMRRYAQSLTVSLSLRRLVGTEMPQSFVYDLVRLLQGLTRLEDLALELSLSVQPPTHTGSQGRSGSHGD